MNNTSVPDSFTADEFDNLKLKACWVDSAIQGHRQGIFTIVDCKHSWAVYKNGIFLNVMSWEGNKGTPQGVPCVPKSTYLENYNQLRLLGIEPTAETQLRGNGIELNLQQMLEVMTLDGARMVLPTNVIFDPRSYQMLKKALLNAGGSYHDSSFHFDDDDSASEALSRLLQGENINIKKTLQYYPTTDTAGDRLLAGVDFTGKVVFEPSAGEGYLVKRALEIGAKRVLAVEIYTKFHTALEQAGAELIGSNIFDVNACDLLGVDVVVMNPPFSGGQDVKHVQHVLSILPPHVEVHAIMSCSVLENSNGIYEDFRAFMEKHGVEPERLEAGAFKESGTMVKTCIVRIPRRSCAAIAA